MTITTTSPDSIGGSAAVRTHAVIDPSDGSVIRSIPISTEDECAVAVAVAQAAQHEFAALAPRVRGEMLRRAFEIMTAEVEELAHLVSRENGKVLGDARAEIAYAAEFFRWFSEEAVRVAGELRQAPAGGRTIMVVREPVGVSLLITPWNFPAAMATRKLGPAIAAGCATVLKPAMETPLTALAIVDVLRRAGVPDGVVTVVTPIPAGPAVTRMLDSGCVRNLSFTGSTEVGQILLKQAASRVIRTSMELGVNAQFLVLEEADIDEAVAGEMIAKMRNGGAACTAANRFYVARSVVDEFSHALALRMGSLRVAPGISEGAGVGASVSLAERNKIAQLVSDAVGAGAEVLVGGVVPDGPGAFYPPTVLTVGADDPILGREIFGPVAPIVAVDSDDEAIRLANSSEFGLISYVYSRDVGRAMRTARALESGMVAINKGVISDPAAPFGGYKQSGLGREGGFDGINEFLESKYIGVDL